MAIYYYDPSISSFTAGDGTIGNPYHSHIAAIFAVGRTFLPGDEHRFKKSEDPIELPGTLSWVYSSENIDTSEDLRPYVKVGDVIAKDLWSNDGYYLVKRVSVNSIQLVNEFGGVTETITSCKILGIPVATDSPMPVSEILPFWGSSESDASLMSGGWDFTDPENPVRNGKTIFIENIYMETSHNDEAVDRSSESYDILANYGDYFRIVRIGDTPGDNDYIENVDWAAYVDSFGGPIKIVWLPGGNSPEVGNQYRVTYGYNDSPYYGLGLAGLGIEMYMSGNTGHCDFEGGFAYLRFDTGFYFWGPAQNNIVNDLNCCCCRVGYDEMYAKEIDGDYIGLYGEDPDNPGTYPIADDPWITTNTVSNFIATSCFCGVQCVVLDPDGNMRPTGFNTTFEDVIVDGCGSFGFLMFGTSSPNVSNISGSCCGALGDEEFQISLVSGFDEITISSGNVVFVYCEDLKITGYVKTRNVSAQFSGMLGGLGIYRCSGVYIETLEILGAPSLTPAPPLAYIYGCGSVQIDNVTINDSVCGLITKGSNLNIGTITADNVYGTVLGVSDTTMTIGSLTVNDVAIICSLYDTVADVRVHRLSYTNLGKTLPGFGYTAETFVPVGIMNLLGGEAYISCCWGDVSKPWASIQHFNADDVTKAFSYSATMESDEVEADSGKCLKLTKYPEPLITNTLFSFIDRRLDKMPFIVPVATFKATSGLDSYTITLKVKRSANYNGVFNLYVNHNHVTVYPKTPQTLTASYQTLSLTIPAVSIGEDGYLDVIAHMTGDIGSVYIDTAELIEE